MVCWLVLTANLTQPGVTLEESLNEEYLDHVAGHVCAELSNL